MSEKKETARQLTFFDGPEFAGDLRLAPEFVRREEEPWKSLKVNFRNAADLQEFGRLIGQDLRAEDGHVWFPRER